MTYRSKSKMTVFGLALASMFSMGHAPAFAQSATIQKSCADVNDLDCLDNGLKDIRSSTQRTTVNKQEVEQKIKAYRESMSDSAGGFVAEQSAPTTVAPKTLSTGGSVPAIGGLGSGLAEKAKETVVDPVAETVKPVLDAPKAKEPETAKPEAQLVNNSGMPEKAFNHVVNAIEHLKAGAAGNILGAESVWAHHDLIDALNAMPAKAINVEQYKKMDWMGAATALLNGQNANLELEGVSKVSMKYYVAGEAPSKYNQMSTRAKAATERTMSVLQDIVDGKMKPGHTAHDYINRAIALNNQIKLLNDYQASERNGTTGRGDPAVDAYVSGKSCGAAIISWSMFGTTENPKGVSECAGGYAPGPKDSTYASGTKALIKSDGIYKRKAAMTGELQIECKDGQWVIINPERASCKEVY